MRENVGRGLAVRSASSQPSVPTSLLLVTGFQCLLVGIGYITRAREACEYRTASTLPDTDLLRGFPCGGNRASQIIYVLLRLPYAFRDLLNYQHPAQWVNTLNLMALIRLPLLLVLPYNLYEYVGTALVYSLRIWPLLVHLLRGPSHRPCPPMTWYLPNGSALELVFFYPSLPAPLPVLEAMYGIASTTGYGVLSYWYASRYSDLGFWPPLVVLLQALATCLTTFLAARWSRNRYGRGSVNSHNYSVGTTVFSAGIAANGRIGVADRGGRVVEVPGVGELRRRRGKAEQGQEVGEGPVKGKDSWGQEEEAQATGEEHLRPSFSAHAAGAAAQARDTAQELRTAPQPPPPELESLPDGQQGQVGAGARVAAELPVYRGRAKLRTLLCKIPGYHLGDIPPGHERRLADAIEQQHQQGEMAKATATGAMRNALGPGAGAAAAAGREPAGSARSMGLRWLHVQEGCIEVLMHVKERVEERGGEGAAAGGVDGPGEGAEQRQGERLGSPRAGVGSGAVPGGTVPPDVRLWELDRETGVYKECGAAPTAEATAAEGGAVRGASAWSANRIVGALQLPDRPAEGQSLDAGAGGQQAQEGPDGEDGEGGQGMGPELVAVDALPRVVLLGAGAGAGGGAAACLRFQLAMTVGHRAGRDGGSASGMGMGDARIDAVLVLLQQRQQCNQQHGDETPAGSVLVPCRVTLRTAGPADAAYDSAGGTACALYDVEADLDGLACGPGPAELHVRVGGLPAGGVPLLITMQRAVAEEVGAAAELQVLLRPQLQGQGAGNPGDGADGPSVGRLACALSEMLFDVGTWEACIAALPAAHTAARGPTVEMPGDDAMAEVEDLGCHLLQYAEACGWDGTAAWIREGLGRLEAWAVKGQQEQGEQQQDGEGTGVEAEGQQDAGGGSASGGSASGGSSAVQLGRKEAEEVEEKGVEARADVGGERQAGLLRRMWLADQPAGYLEQSFQVFETACLLLLPLGEPGGGFRMHANSLIYFGLGALVLLSRAFLTHGSWARLLASYRLPRYLSYIVAKLATVLCGLSVARADLVGGPVQIIFDGVLLPICCPLPAPLAVPLAIINAAAWSAFVLYVEQQQLQQQDTATNYISAVLGPLARPSLLLGSHVGVTGAALAGIRLAVTALLSIAFVSSASWRSGRGRSSRAARTLSGAGGSRSGLGAEHRNRGDHGGPLPAATAAAAAAAGPTSRKS